MDRIIELPKDFEKQIKALLGDQYDSFRHSLETPSPVSIRVNALKPSPESGSRRVPWCKSGRYLDHRPSFTLDPHFHGGAYYVQEASSMFLEQAMKQSIDLEQPLRVLDLCAAPGGKSTHLLSLLSRDSLLVSNEAIRSRASTLSENLQKWGYGNTLVTNNDPSAFAAIEGFFDVMVVDAPCSGEGLFRKDPDAVSEWTLDAVALCSSRQRRIIQDVWPSLKSGGILIYCTCTYNELENENNLTWLREQHDVEFIPIAADFPGVVKVTSQSLSACRFFPHRVDGEGFFISVIRKTEAQQETPRRKPKAEKSRKVAPVAWLNGDFVTHQRGELLIGVPTTCAPDIDFLSGHLNVVTQGVALGEHKHGKFIPEHALALSVDLKKSEFPVMDLGKEEALQYLRKAELPRGDHPKGLSLVQYEGNPLGWINVLDKRMNNLYPSNWRIRNL